MWSVSAVQSYHVQNLKSIDHSGILYRRKLKFIGNQTKIQRRQDSLYWKDVTISWFSEFADSMEHRKLSIFDIMPLKQAKLYLTIRSEALFYRDAPLSKCKADMNNCRIKTILCINSGYWVKHRNLKITLTMRCVMLISNTDVKKRWK